MAAFPTAGKYQFAFNPATAQFATGNLTPSQPMTAEERFNEGLLEMFRQNMDPANRRQMLEEKLAFDREQMKEAGKYKMLFDLPGRITQAFTAPGALMMEGANRVAATTLEGLSRLPQPQVVGRSYAYTPTNYF